MDWHDLTSDEKHTKLSSQALKDTALQASFFVLFCYA